MVVTCVTDSLTRIMTIEVALRETNPETIGAKHYKLSIDRDTYMMRNKDVEAKDDHNLKLDWKNEAQLSNDYARYCDAFLSVLRKFQFMRNGHLGQVNIAKH